MWFKMRIRKGLFIMFKIIYHYPSFTILAIRWSIISAPLRFISIPACALNHSRTMYINNTTRILQFWLFSFLLFSLIFYIDDLGEKSEIITFFTLWKLAILAGRSLSWSSPVSTFTIKFWLLFFTTHCSWSPSIIYYINHLI